MVLILCMTTDPSSKVSPCDSDIVESIILVECVHPFVVRQYPLYVAKMGDEKLSSLALQIALNQSCYSSLPASFFRAGLGLLKSVVTQELYPQCLEPQSSS